LYVLSELAQNSLRASATSHKWLLQAIKTPIILTDDLLQELSTIEDVGKNVHRSYLVRAIEKNRKSDESMRVDTRVDELKESQFTEIECKESQLTEQSTEQPTHHQAQENYDSMNDSISQEVATKRIRRSGRNRATSEIGHDV
jgi:hypothetical protein